jgi:hypothetical protein
MLGSRVLALWWGINVFTSMIIGLGVRFGVSPLGTLGHSNGVPCRGINPQTLKEIASSPKTPTLQGLKTHAYPALKDEACPVVMFILLVGHLYSIIYKPRIGRIRLGIAYVSAALTLIPTILFIQYPYTISRLATHILYAPPTSMVRCDVITYHTWF